MISTYLNKALLVSFAALFFIACNASAKADNSAPQPPISDTSKITIDMYRDMKIVRSFAG